MKEVKTVSHNGMIYYLLLPVICFGFWGKKSIIRKLTIYIIASLWFLQMSKHEASNKTWQRIDLRFVFPFCT